MYHLRCIFTVLATKKKYQHSFEFYSKEIAIETAKKYTDVFARQVGPVSVAEHIGDNKEPVEFYRTDYGRRKNPDTTK